MEAEVAELSHNLAGQRLGRKGRITRDRIVAATQALLAGPQASQITMSAIAREASLGMTSLYNYFNDLTEVLLAVLEPVMASAEDAYFGQLRNRWADDQLEQRAHDFASAYFQFWHQYSAVLHLRNSMSDQGDRRMAKHRIDWAVQVIRLLVEQMGHNPDAINSPANSMATVLYTGLDRVVTVATNLETSEIFPRPFAPNVKQHLLAEARLFAVGIEDYRTLTA